MQINPEMIMLARESRGLTQTALARELGIAQGTISKIENGELQPELALVERLAAHLQYDLEFFAETWRYKELPVAFFRKQASVSAATQRQIRAYANVRLLALKKLLHSTDIPECRIEHVKAGSGRLWFDRAAAEMRSSWDVQPGPLANLSETLESLGVIILRADFGTEKVDGLSFHEAGVGPVIMVRAGLPGDRWRFTLAHELAHLVFDGRGAPRPDLEDDANAFASAFLLPAHDVRPYLSRLTLQKLASLKKHWGVSMQSLMRRAFDLGLLSERQRRYLYVQLAREGYSRAHEPDVVIREQPTLFQEVLDFHLDDLGYSERQLRKLLHLDIDEVRAMAGEQAQGLRLVHTAPSRPNAAP